MTAEAAAPHDSATVWTTAAGVPERVVFGGRRFVVSARPIPWIERMPWWEPTSRAGGGSARTQERNMWQVQVTAEDNGEILILDLAVSAGRHWPVTGIYD